MYLHFLQLALVVDLLFCVIFDVIEGEDVIVLFDPRHGLLTVDVLKRLEDATTVKLLISDHHHLVHFLFTVLSPAFIILLILLLHYQFKLYITPTGGKHLLSKCKMFKVYFVCFYV